MGKAAHSDGAVSGYSLTPMQAGARTAVSMPEDKNAKYRDIRELFKVQKTEQMDQQVVAQLLQMIGQKILANQKQQLMDTLQKEVHFEDLTEMLVPIYDRNFTHAEIQQVLQFYKTPAGQKFVTSQPKIMQESSMAVQQWAARLSARVDASLKSQERKPSSNN